MRLLPVKYILLAVAAALGPAIFLLGGWVQADAHLNGHARIQGRGDGQHHLHTTPQGHVAHAHISRGKVRGVNVSHQGRGVAVRKFKTSRRLHAQASVPQEVQFANLDGDRTVYILAENGGGDLEEVVGGQFTAYVGFGFYNQFTNQWVIFWFPVTLVEGGDAGATYLGNAST